MIFNIKQTCSMLILTEIKTKFDSKLRPHICCKTKRILNLCFRTQQAKPVPKWPDVRPSAPKDQKPDPSKIGWNVPPAQTQHRPMPQPGTGLQHNSHQQSANPPPYNPAFSQQQKPPYPMPQPGAGIPQPNAGFPQSHAGYPQPNAAFPQPNAGFGQPKSPYPQQNPGFPQQNPGFPQQNPGFPPQNPGFPPPNSGFPQQAYPQGFPNQQVPHYPQGGYPQQFPPSQGMFGSNPGFGSPMGGVAYPGQYGQKQGLGTGGALAAGLGAGVLGGVVGAVGANLAGAAIRNKFNSHDDYGRDRTLPPGVAAVTPLPDGALPADAEKMPMVPAVNMTGNMTGNGTDEGVTSENPLASTEIPMGNMQPNPYYNPYNQNPYYNPYYPNPYYQPQGTWVNGTFVPYVPQYQLGPDGQPIPYASVPPSSPEGAQNVPIVPQPGQEQTQNSPVATTTMSPGSTTILSETTTGGPQNDTSTAPPTTAGTPLVETSPSTTTAKA